MTASILIADSARDDYLHLDRRCKLAYSPAIAPYVADEIRREVLSLATDPTRDYLQRHRVADGEYFVVEIPTPADQDNAAIFWRFDSTGARADVRVIELAYR